MKISIKVFDVLNDLAKSHKINDVSWAMASNIRRPTIPELRRVSNASKSGIVDLGIKRACTIEKILMLSAGLIKKLGSPLVNAALRNWLEVEPDQDFRLITLILILQNSDKEKKDKAEAMLQEIIKLI